jgi:hypothetical protein
MKDSIMEVSVNFGLNNVSITMFALRHGMTVYHVHEFDKADFLHHVLKWKVKFIAFFFLFITFLSSIFLLFKI